MEEMLRDRENTRMASYCNVYSYFKRFSHEEKYKIELKNQETYFVKVCDAVHFERKQEEYTYMKQLESLHIPTPKLIHFIIIEKLNKCVQYLNGTEV